MRTLLFSLWLLAPWLLAQTPTAPAVKPPELSEMDKLKLQNKFQQMQIAQMKAEAAQREFDAARTDLMSLAKELEKPGYDINLQTLTYVKKEDTKKE